MLGGYKQNLVQPGPRERNSDSHKRLRQIYLWVFEGLLWMHGSAVACHRDRGSGRSPRRHGVWHKSPWRSSSLAPLENCYPQTGEKLYQRRSLTVVKGLAPTTDFPTWGSGKETENPQGIWLWRSVEFDYRTSTVLGKQRLLQETNKTLCTTGLRRQEQWIHKTLSQTCMWVSGSLQQRHGLTVTCCGVRGTDSSSPWRPGILA